MENVAAEGVGKGLDSFLRVGDSAPSAWLLENEGKRMVR